MLNEEAYLHMNEVDYFKNFNLGKEIDLAGSFAYNALSILNMEDNVYQNDQIFLFLYNTAVSVERLQKCVLFIYGNYDETSITDFAASLKSHDHQMLQSRITEITHKKLSAEQNSLLMLLSGFYLNGRYANYSFGDKFDCKSQLEEFVKKNYDASMVEPNFLGNDTIITESAKERIGRTLGKLLSYYYDIIKEKSRALNLYTYELRSGSSAEKVFLNTFPKKSVQAISQTERNALAELIVYLINTTDNTGYLYYLREIKPLSFDPYLVQEYLAEILKRQTPQDLVDEVETIYEDFSHEEIEERKQSLLIMNERNVFFPEDDEDE